MNKKQTKMARGVIKTAAGMAVTKPEDFLKLAAHAGDLFLKRQFSQALHDTYAYFVNIGKIDPKYFNSKDFADLTPEFGTVQDSNFGEEKLNYLRKIFVNLAKDNQHGSHKKYLLDIALEMSEPEMRIVITDYRLANGELDSPFEQGRETSARRWLEFMAEESGLEHEDLVAFHESSLIQKKLITDRFMVDRSSITWNAQRSRLTTMGYELCEMMFLTEDPLE